MNEEFKFLIVAKLSSVYTNVEWLKIYNTRFLVLFH